MPQFDLTPYLSQAFWLVICFGFMYLLISSIVFPMFDDVFTERESKIQDDLESADRINKSAEKLIKDYDEFVLSSQQQKAFMLKSAYEELHKTSSKIEADREQKIRKKMQKTEDELASLREQVQQDSDVIAKQAATKLVQKLYGVK